MIVDLTRTISDIWYNQNRVEENEQMSIDDFIEQINSAYETAQEQGFDSIVLAIDTDIDTTYYINDTPEGFQCDLWDYYFDSLEDIAEQLYNEMHGTVTDIRIE